MSYNLQAETTNNVNGQTVIESVDWPVDNGEGPILYVNGTTNTTAAPVDAILGQGNLDGNGVVGFGGQKGGTGVSGYGGTSGPGVVGQAGSGTADGVQGYGTGTFSGVAGFGDPTVGGTGVFGEGRGPQAPGVRGIGSGGPNNVPETPVGVFGQAGSGSAYGVQGVGSGTLAGVGGFGDPAGAGTGVYGVGQGAGALGVWAIGSGGSAETAPYGGAVGVFGQAGSGNTNGVEGHGSGTLAGVAGMGDLSSGGASGIGVFGQGGAPATGSNGPGGPGVHGVGFGGGYTPLGQAVGVYGLGGAGGSPGVLGTGGTPTADGVQGISGSGAGVSGQSSSGVGVSGFSDSGVGLIAQADNEVPGTIGLIATGNAFAGQFDGNVLVSGELTVSGKKSAAVPFPDGSHRRLYCMESPESWFEDFGSGDLTAGKAVVRLDPNFAAAVQTNEYHVFLNEYDRNTGLYVTNRTETGFEVRSNAPAKAGAFSYRVVARRKDIVSPRFEPVTLPTGGAKYFRSKSTAKA
jgi:hypothetical protein